jgi:hypothetical protein
MLVAQGTRKFIGRSASFCRRFLALESRTTEKESGVMGSFGRFILFSCLVLLTATANTSQFRDSLDLAQYLDDSAALNKLIIRYDDSTSKLLFVYGDGRVVRQTSMPGDLVPTCKGRVEQDRIRLLVGGFISNRFFDLPQKSYLVIVAADNPWKEMKLHSITFDDGTAHAKREFAYGTYGGKTEPVPWEFSKSEEMLVQLEREAIRRQPCQVAPRIELPKVDHGVPPSDNFPKSG